MKTPAVNLDASGLLALVAVLGLAGFGLYVWKRGGVAAVVGDVVTGTVTAAGEVVTGTVGTAGQVVGLPTPDQTTTDPAVARWLIDNVSLFEASKWASAGALARALFMGSGSGTPPTAGTAVAERFGTQRLPTGYRMNGYGQLMLPDDAVEAETRRLLDRYPVTGNVMESLTRP